jgi:hypothetical protein
VIGNLDWSKNFPNICHNLAKIFIKYLYIRNFAPMWQLRGKKSQAIC